MDAVLPSRDWNKGECARGHLNRAETFRHHQSKGNGFLSRNGNADVVAGLVKGDGKVIHQFAVNDAAADHAHHAQFRRPRQGAPRNLRARHDDFAPMRRCQQIRASVAASGPGTCQGDLAQAFAAHAENALHQSAPYVETTTPSSGRTRLTTPRI